MPLAPPPRDASGTAVPHDHSEIGADDKVIRRISVEQHVVSDGRGGRRISSIAFSPSTDAYSGLSVDIEKSITEAGLDPQKFVTSPPFMGSVWLQVGKVREESFQVGFDPLPGNPHHGEIWGAGTKARKRRLQQLASWYVEIMGVAVS